MAAWTYHDYLEQSTLALRITRLRQHMSEVNARVSAAVSAGGKSRSTADLVAYLQHLARQLRDLEEQAGQDNRGSAVGLADLS